MPGYRLLLTNFIGELKFFIVLFWGRLKMQDWKMKDRRNHGGGKCRTGKWRTKVQGWKMQDWKMTDESARLENVGLENDG